jgi:hypothetical protein
MKVVVIVAGNDTTPCILLQEIARRRTRTANCAQYRDYYEVKLNVTNTQIMVKVAEIVLAFQTLVNFQETCDSEFC